MIRGSVTILVLLGLVGRIVVPVSHAHAYNTPEHDAVPHVHVGDASHNHSHDDGSPGHHHDDEPSQSSTANVEPGTVSATGQHHDSDAVWFPSAAGSILCVKAGLSSVVMDAGAVVSEPIDVRDGNIVLWRFAPWDLRAPSSKLYLLLRNLRL